MQMMAGGVLSSVLTCDSQENQGTSCPTETAWLWAGRTGSCFLKSNSLQQFGFATSGISHLIIGLILPKLVPLRVWL